MNENTEFALKKEWHDDMNTHTYVVPLEWSLTPYILDKKKGVLVFGQGKRKMFLCFCMATEHLCKIEPAHGLGVLTAFLVSNTYVEVKNGKPTSCEEGRHCLNIDCPINRTTKESFVLMEGISERAAKTMNWEAITSYRKITMRGQP